MVLLLYRVIYCLTEYSFESNGFRMLKIFLRRNVPQIKEITCKHFSPFLSEFRFFRLKNFIRQARKVEKLYRLVDVNNMEATKLRRFTNGRSKNKKCATDYNNYRVPLNESGESNKVLVYLVFSSLCTKHGKFCVTVCKIHFICVTAHL